MRKTREWSEKRVIIIEEPVPEQAPEPVGKQV